MEEFRVIIAGGRDFKDYELLKRVCDKLLITKRFNKKIIILSGKAKGADYLGEVYAKENGFEVDPHPANWKREGKAAGPIRNKEMATVAHALIAFWDGKSRGTGDMIEQAKAHGLQVAVQKYNQWIAVLR